MRSAALPSALSDRRVSAAVVALAVAGLAARLYRLGARVFYFDEAWFGYWVLKTLDHGAWEYRPVLHGPFFVRVNGLVFQVLGASDATGRLVVAVIGGLLPLSAWLFRERLRDVEVVALAALLALNPLVVYYSRFMRKDLPLAAFMLVTLGLLVRAADTRRPRYLHAAGVSLGLAFTTKESVLLWLVTWLGAGALVLDRKLLRARDQSGSAVAAVRRWVDGAVPAVTRWAPHAVLASGLCLVVVVYFYAPRAGDGGGVGLWRALGGEYGTVPAVVGEATVGSFRTAVDHWVAGPAQDHPYLPYLGDTLQTLWAGAASVVLLAALGFLSDRYGGDGPRDLVAFNAYCGAAATVGYPLANNFAVPWSTLHAVVPLAIPAAVGAGVLYRWGTSQLPAYDRAALGRVRSALGREPTNRDDVRTDGGPEAVHWRRVRAAVAAALVAMLLASAVGTTVQASYLAPHESPQSPSDQNPQVGSGSEIVYYAQAPAALREVIRAIRRAAAEDGTDPDVLYVGSKLAMNESAVERPPKTGAWLARNPLPWYTEVAGAGVASTSDPAEVGPNAPPVVITTPSARDAVDGQLGRSYRARHYDLDDVGDREIVAFRHERVR